jgi:hypothetical protein
MEIKNISDVALACCIGLTLLGIAAYVIFVIHPGGFEGHIAWFFCLLPGSMLASLVFAAFHYSIEIRSEAGSIVFWASIFSFSFLWYVAISYGLIKARHLVSEHSRH